MLAKVFVEVIKYGRRDNAQYFRWKKGVRAEEVSRFREDKVNVLLVVELDDRRNQRGRSCLKMARACQAHMDDGSRNQRPGFSTIYSTSQNPTFNKNGIHYQASVAH